MSGPCWRCGAPLEGMILPVSRRETCRACGAEIHVCRMCVHFDDRRSQWCREERAEPPRETDRANFCDYFAPASEPRRRATTDDQARAALDALFGGEAQEGKPDSDPRQNLDDLFDLPK